MFRKLVSNLAFSPTLIGQFSFYAKRLKKEEFTRQLSVFFVILALIVQSFAVFQPAESANASSSSDMVSGGLGLGDDRSLDNYLTPYDANTKYLHDTMNYVGITRDEIVSTQFTSFKVGKRLSWGFAPTFSYEQGERQYSIPNSDGQIVTTVYSRPLNLRMSEDTDVWGWVGHSSKIGWFAIMQSCGNLVTEITPTPPAPAKCALNPSLLEDDPNCKPCPGNSTLWTDDPACTPNLIKSKKAINSTQGSVDASSVIAKADDQITYTITIENNGLKATQAKFEDYLADTLEYSNIIDNGGGNLDKSTKILTWPETTLEANSKQTRTFIVQMLSIIPSTAKGNSNENSYDCIVTNTFGNSIDTKVDCPALKTVETTVAELPKTGASENMLFIGILLAITTYFYARARQMKKEIRLIRKSANTGII